ncbi:sulfotransferase 1C2-like isoform X1 [Haliotis rufescens]|uniref:sulfotransferase 1C2-like isoform X1 n=2 Tax=Haliotis rufescens TaxID=6454 RepID=UPI00201E9252|nr:sulfotransferase 1C2-like isoform X1 [Haliotis rufescens]
MTHASLNVGCRGEGSVVAVRMDPSTTSTLKQPACSSLCETSYQQQRNGVIWRLCAGELVTDSQWTMPRVRVLDRSGHGLNFVDVDGRWFPGDVDEQLIRGVPDMEIRDDDVIICGWMRSGTHWTFEMTNMILNGSAQTVEMPKQDQMIERISLDQQRALLSPRVLNTHLRFHHLPLSARKKKTKIILLLRNPRDCAVSWFNFQKTIEYFDYDGSWEDWLQLFLEGKMDWGSWFDYVRDWERVVDENPDHPIFLLHYEEHKADPVEAVERLSRFLDCPVTSDLSRKIADECSFDKMKDNKRNFAWTSQSGVHVHYRKGKVGDWKNWFTVRQCEEFDKVYRQKMAGSRFERLWSS